MTKLNEEQQFYLNKVRQYHESYSQAKIEYRAYYNQLFQKSLKPFLKERNEMIRKAHAVGVPKNQIAMMGLDTSATTEVYKAIYEGEE